MPSEKVRGNSVRTEDQQPPPLLVVQTRSVIGTKPKHRGTLRALGLRGVGSSRLHRNTPSLLGMIARVPHLVRVRERPDLPNPQQRHPRYQSRSQSRTEQLHSRKQVTEWSADAWHYVPSEDPLSHSATGDTAPMTLAPAEHYSLPGGEQGVLVLPSEKEWLKAEPQGDVVSVHWSTSVMNGNDLVGTLSAEDQFAPTGKRRKDFRAVAVTGSGSARDEIRGFERIRRQPPDVLEQMHFFVATVSRDSYQWRIRSDGQPQFGWQGRVDRLSQILPALLRETGSSTVSGYASQLSRQLLEDLAQNRIKTRRGVAS
jgi:large subunit ribosomal protein L30